MRSLLGLSVLLVLSSPATADPAAEVCPLTDSMFSAKVDALSTWTNIRDYVKAYFPPCKDEGVFAQAHSEVVARTLASKWNQLSELSSNIRADSSFRDFIVKHINERSGQGDLNIILSYATIRCPRGEIALCQTIRESAAKALERLK